MWWKLGQIWKWCQANFMNSFAAIKHIRIKRSLYHFLEYVWSLNIYIYSKNTVKNDLRNPSKFTSHSIVKSKHTSQCIGTPKCVLLWTKTSQSGFPLHPNPLHCFQCFVTADGAFRRQFNGVLNFLLTVTISRVVLSLNKRKIGTCVNSRSWIWEDIQNSQGMPTSSSGFSPGQLMFLFQF